MIPRLTELEPTTRRYRDFLAALPGAGFHGELQHDLASRLVTATDNSVYQVMPQAVAFPQSTEDVAAFMKTLARPEFREITMAPRGGGTGTNGQSLTEGVVLDLSRRMRRILELDLEGGWVRVQPGVVLDQLNAYLKPHGVFFAPNLSPSSRATLGGMISTDACGKGSRIYGRTSEHVLELTVVLGDGAVLRTAALDEATLDGLCAREDRCGAAHREVRRVVRERADLIEEVFPKLRRFMTGYNLAKVESSAGFDLAQLISGSEGTLGVVTEARLRLTPLPSVRRLVVVKYPSFEAALASAAEIVRSDPGAIETIDATVMDLARKDVIWHAVGPILDPEDARDFATVNLIEYEGTDAAAVEAKVQALLESLELPCVLAEDETARVALWSLRKKGVGLLANAPGPRKPVAFVEDTVVPPERLPEYVAAFRAVLDEEGVSYGMFGHIDVGCLHVRPALDLKDPADEARLRRISDRVCALTKEYGGMIWGEHGKGFRSEYNAEFFGEALFPEICAIKAAFDPADQINPGKLASPKGLEGLVQVDDPRTRGALDRQIPEAVREVFGVTVDCNGNGQCFDYHPDHVMCPSSKVTRDRIHSPKGRAGVMREWLRQLASAGYDPTQPRKPGLLGRWLRAIPGLSRRPGSGKEEDYSHEVYAAMSGCLACKACATHCPVRVDVPQFRSEFLDLYHTRYRRPLKDHLIAGLESWLAWMARAPRLMNALMHNPVAVWGSGLLGMVDTPLLSVPTARERLEAEGIPSFDLGRLQGLDAEQRARTVVIVQDAFTTFYDAEVLTAACRLLTHLNLRVEVMPYFPSGKGMHVRGFLKRFDRHARRSADRLARIAELGLQMVGIEPAVVLVFRDEFPHALGESSPRVQLLQEWLAANIERMPEARSSARYRLFAHCTERTAEAESQLQWRRIFERAGLQLELMDLGCCGMCGAFGHEAAHYAESKGIFEMSWAKHLPQTTAERVQVLTTGHSCRHQVERFAGFTPRHPIEVLAERLVR